MVGKSGEAAAGGYDFTTQDKTEGNKSEQGADGGWFRNRRKAVRALEIAEGLGGIGIIEGPVEAEFSDGWVDGVVGFAKFDGNDLAVSGEIESLVCKVERP